MNITLISPYPDLRGFGIRTLSACLKAEQHDVQMIFLPTRFDSDSFVHSYEESTLDDLIDLARSSDLVGNSLMTNFFDNAVQMTQQLKKDLEAPILWGGIRPTIRPEECLNYADMICIGEGEHAVVELAKRMSAGEDYMDVSSM